MNAEDRRLLSPGPFRADNIKEGEPYELSNGHAVLCLPTGARGGLANLVGGAVLESDPSAVSVGVDVGFSPGPRVLRAPDISVGDFPNAPGWAPGVPPLAVEYADTGQDEADLQDKIIDLLAAGTKHVWVVRLVGPRRVEIYEPGKSMRLAGASDVLLAPGLLKNPVPVAALYDRDAAHDATLRNLLQRRGYEDLAAVRDEGRDEGRLEAARNALRLVLAQRGLAVSPEEEARIDGCVELATLNRWLGGAVVATTTGDALA